LAFNYYLPKAPHLIVLLLPVGDVCKLKAKRSLILATATTGFELLSEKAKALLYSEKLIG